MEVRALGAGLAQALLIKERALGGQAGPGPVDKSEGLGGPGRPRALSIKVRDWEAGPAQAQNIVSLTCGSRRF